MQRQRTFSPGAWGEPPKSCDESLMDVGLFSACEHDADGAVRRVIGQAGEVDARGNGVAGAIVAVPGDRSGRRHRDAGHAPAIEGVHLDVAPHWALRRIFAAAAQERARLTVRPSRPPAALAWPSTRWESSRCWAAG